MLFRSNLGLEGQMIFGGIGATAVSVYAIGPDSTRLLLMGVAASIGGMLFPALIYTLLNHGGPGQSGWAVPMPTDIALAVGALALLGSRVDTSLKIFLLTLAIADDLFSIIILGAFYSSGLSPIKIFSTVGVVAIALLAPEMRHLPTTRLITILHPWTAFLIIPIFILMLLVV